jgi:hypothetical protein
MIGKKWLAWSKEAGNLGASCWCVGLNWVWVGFGKFDLKETRKNLQRAGSGLVLDELLSMLEAGCCAWVDVVVGNVELEAE